MKRRIASIAIAMALVIGSLAGCSQQSATPAKTAGTAIDGNEVSIETAAIKLVKAVKEGEYSLVSTAELKAMIDQKKDMIIIDTMPKATYDAGHIPGALNAELPKEGLSYATDEQKAAFVKLLGDNKDKQIVLYCGFVACERSHVGALIAKENGFKNVARYPGGLIAWQDAKYETQK
jgi:thiosulfate/3-mercaptopyruvate sulfurtransferase